LTIDKKTAKVFLRALFEDILATRGGFIEIRQINNGQLEKRAFYPAIEDLFKTIDQYRGNIFFGVAPRMQKGGGKKSINYVTSIWTDIDIGEEGHKGRIQYQNIEETEKVINASPLKPSIIVDSGHGLHLYWLLRQSEEANVYKIENILDGIKNRLKGDAGTSEIAHLLRLPGTTNCKIPEKPKEVKIIFIDPLLRYELNDFRQYEEEGEKGIPSFYGELIVDIEELPLITFEELQKKGISPTILYLIKKGDTEAKYLSRSERDQAVIIELLLKGFTPGQILAVFRNSDLSISDRYLEKGTWGNHYILYSIKKARVFIESKQIEMAPEKAKKVPIPVEVYGILERFLDSPLMPWELEEYKEINNKNYLIYKREVRTKERKEVNEYQIKKDTLNPNERVPLDTMKKAYILSLNYAIEQKNFIVEFPLAEKFKEIEKKNISGQCRREWKLAEILLANTQFRRIKKMGNVLIEEYQNLYAGIKFTREKETSRIMVQVTLNPSYLKALDQETGRIEGQYIPQELPLKEPRESKELYKRRTLDLCNKWGWYRNDGPKRIKYNVKTLLEDIKAKPYELARPGLCRGVWDYIKPAFEQAGHKIVKILVNDEKKRDDVRAWTLVIGLKDRRPKEVGA